MTYIATKGETLAKNGKINDNYIYRYYMVSVNDCSKQVILKLIHPYIVTRGGTV